MNEYSLLAHFLFGLLSTGGFCLLFHIPKKQIFFSAVNGALGWTAFQYLMLTGNSKVLSCFMGALVVAVVAEFFSRAGREATTLFIIPGIVPLVPGAGMYNTMLCIMENDLQKAASTGIEALAMAGCIALALLVSASITRLLNSIALTIIGVIKKWSRQKRHLDVPEDEGIQEKGSLSMNEEAENQESGGL